MRSCQIQISFVVFSSLCNLNFGSYRVIESQGSIDLKGNVFIRSEFLDRTSSFEIWKFENWMKRDGKALMRKFGSRGRKGRGIWNRWTEVRLRGGRRRRKGGREREKTEEEASMGNPPT